MFKQFLKTITVLVIALGLIPTALPHSFTIILPDKSQIKVDGLNDDDTLETLKVKVVEKCKELKKNYLVSNIYFYQTIQRVHKDTQVIQNIKRNWITDNFKISEILKHEFYDDKPFTLELRSKDFITIFLPDGKNTLVLPIHEHETPYRLALLINEAIKHDLADADKTDALRPLVDNPMKLYASGEANPLVANDPYATPLFNEASSAFTNERYQILSLNTPFPNDFDFEAELRKQKDISKAMDEMSAIKLKFEQRPSPPRIDASSLEAFQKSYQAFASAPPESNPLGQIQLYIQFLQNKKRINTEALPLFSANHFGSKSSFIQNVYGYMSDEIYGKLIKPIYVADAAFNLTYKMIFGNLIRELINSLESTKTIPSSNTDYDQLLAQQRSINDACVAYDVYKDLNLLPENTDPLREALAKAYDAAKVALGKVEELIKAENLKKANAVRNPIIDQFLKGFPYADGDEEGSKLADEIESFRDSSKPLSSDKQVELQSRVDQLKDKKLQAAQADKAEKEKLLNKINAQIALLPGDIDKAAITAEYDRLKKLEPSAYHIGALEALAQDVTKLLPPSHEPTSPSPTQKSTLEGYKTPLLIGASVVAATGIATVFYRKHQHAKKVKEKVKEAAKKLNKLSLQEREEQFQEIIHEFGLTGSEKEVVAQLSSLESKKR